MALEESPQATGVALASNLQLKMCFLLVFLEWKGTKFSSLSFPWEKIYRKKRFIDFNTPDSTADIPRSDTPVNNDKLQKAARSRLILMSADLSA